MEEVDARKKQCNMAIETLRRFALISSQKFTFCLKASKAFM